MEHPQEERQDPQEFHAKLSFHPTPGPQESQSIFFNMDHLQGLTQDPPRNSMLNHRVMPAAITNMDYLLMVRKLTWKDLGGSQHRSGSFSEVDMAQKWLQAKFVFIPC